MRRARSVIYWITLLAMAAAIVWMLLYRPQFVPEIEDAPVESREGGSLKAGSGSRPAGHTESVAGARRAETVEVQPFSVVRTTQMLDYRQGLAAARWQRVLAGLSAAVSSPVGATESLEELAALAVLLDSSSLDVAAVESLVNSIHQASRQPGDQAYMLSVLYVAARRMAVVMAEQAYDMRSCHVAASAALDAAGNGDLDEYDIKMNVANAFRRKAEQRVLTLERRMLTVRKAAQSLGGK